MKNVKQVQYTLLTKIVVLLLLLGRIAGFYVTLPGNLDFESVPDGGRLGFIVNMVLANISRLATFVVAYFVFTGNRKAGVAAWVVFAFTLIHCISYGFPKLGLIFYSFDYNYLRLYVTLLFSLVMLLLVYRESKQ